MASGPHALCELRADPLSLDRLACEVEGKIEIGGKRRRDAIVLDGVEQPGVIAAGRLVSIEERVRGRDRTLDQVNGFLRLLHEADVVAVGREPAAERVRDMRQRLLLA